ncbi:MAG: hypothetical protein KJO11_00975 [Gemmatimonadetes bacterium]|nr:hypothetical protein [Gemmatimonadota bacterium]
MRARAGLLAATSAPLAFALLAFALLAFTLSPAPAPAQVARVSPADSAAVLLEAACTFEAEGRSAVAEALYRLILRRFPDAPAAVEARAALGLLERRDASDGSTELQVWGTLFGAWLGVAVPGAFGADEPEPYGLGLLVGAPAGFFTSRTVAKRTNLTIGQARAITWGGTWGTWQGFGWREVFDIGEGDAADCIPNVPCDYGGNTDEETFAAMIVGGAVGIAAGALLSRGSITDAQATAANFGALWGSWFGVATGIIADLEDDDLLAATLVGGDAGLAGAAIAAPSLGWSRNRWRLVSIGGLLGGVAGLGINLLAEVDDDKAFVGIPLATSLVGLGVGVAASRDRDGVDSAGDVGPAAGALLEFDVAREGLAVGTPLPSFRRLPVERDGGVRWRTTLGLTLLRARF